MLGELGVWPGEELCLAQPGSVNECVLRLSGPEGPEAPGFVSVRPVLRLSASFNSRQQLAAAWINCGHCTAHAPAEPQDGTGGGAHSRNSMVSRCLFFPQARWNL